MLEMSRELEHLFRGSYCSFSFVLRVVLMSVECVKFLRDSLKLLMLCLES